MVKTAIQNVRMLTMTAAADIDLYVARLMLLSEQGWDGENHHSRKRPKIASEAFLQRMKRKRQLCNLDTVSFKINFPAAANRHYRNDGNIREIFQKLISGPEA